MDTKNLYSTGRYGVVDVYYRRIWVNTWSETLAHDLRRTFMSHTLTAVVDLGCFGNYRDDIIDSNVCLDWKIPYMEHDDPAVYIWHSNLAHDETLSHLSGSLINEPTITLLDQTQTTHLQEMMLFYLYFMNEFTKVNIDDLDQHLRIVNDIFRTEIDLGRIKERIHEYAEKNFVKSFGFSRKTLFVLEREYG